MGLEGNVAGVRITIHKPPNQEHQQISAFPSARCEEAIRRDRSLRLESAGCTCLCHFHIAWPCLTVIEKKMLLLTSLKSHSYCAFA